MTTSSTRCSQRVQLLEESNIWVTPITRTTRTLTTAGLLVAVLMTAVAVVGAGAVPTSALIASSTIFAAESKILGKSNDRRARHADGTESCAVAGCSLCSDTNGCLRCEPSHYLLLVRDYMQQRGSCVLACPFGYYPSERDVPSDEEPLPPPTTTIRKCHKCNIRSCSACHSRHYCTHCVPPSTAFRGQCYDPCTAVEAATNGSVADCPPSAECSAGPWSSWATSSNRQLQDGAAAWPASGISRKLGLVKSRSRDVLVRWRLSGSTDLSALLLLPCIVRTAESRPCGGESPEQSAADGCDLSSLQFGARSASASSAAAQGTTTVSGQLRNEYKPRKRKPRPGAKPLKSCATEAESGAAVAAVTQPCHRVRHGGGRVNAASTTSAVPIAAAAVPPRDIDTPPSGCGCSAALPSTQPPPTATARSAAARVAQQSSTLEAGEPSPQRTVETAMSLGTPPPTTATPGSPRPTLSRFVEPSTAADLLSAEYYNYYLRLAKQLLRNRQAAMSAAAMSAAAGS